MSDPIRVLLADDHSLFRAGVRVLLDLEPDIEVIGEAANGEEALRRARMLNPDVVLMDLQMPVLDGATATRLLHEDTPTARVVILAEHEEDSSIFAALRSGAIGYLVKNATFEELTDSIRTAMSGGIFIQPALAGRIVATLSHKGARPPARRRRAARGALSNREQEILNCVATGASNRDIATQLELAEGTVRNHLTRIFGKLGVRDRAHAALRGRELGIV